MSRGNPPDWLNAEALRRACAGQRFGHRLEVSQEVTSTNDIVLQLASENEEGLVVFAERQTAGRGQRGNRWASADGKSLCFSVLLRPKIALAETPRLPEWAARVVAAAIDENLSLGATVKPPNDVYIGARKVAGVLVEMRAVTDAPHLGILGIGINVNQTLADFPEELRERAGSLAMAAGGEVDRQELAILILRKLDQSYRALAL